MTEDLLRVEIARQARVIEDLRRQIEGFEWALADSDAFIVLALPQGEAGAALHNAIARHIVRLTKVSDEVKKEEK